MDQGAVFTGNAGANTFNGFEQNVAGVATSTWSAGDSIDGGDGIDTFSVVQTAGITNAPVGSSVKNIEIVNLTSGGAVTLDTTTSLAGFTGLTDLNVISTGVNSLTAAGTTNIKATVATPAGTTTIVGGKAVTATVAGVAATNAISVGTAAAAPVDNVTISSTGSFTNAAAGAVTVIGGKAISVTQAITNSATTNTTTSGAVNVTGTANTTSVAVKNAPVVAVAAAVADVANTSNVVAAKGGVAAGAVTVADANAANDTTATVASKAGTITSVSLDNYGAATISSAALNTLTLAGTGTSVTTLEAGSTALTNKTLTLNLNGGTHGAVTDGSNQFSKAVAVLTANTTVADIAGTAYRTLEVSGTGVLSLTTANTALTSVTLAGAAGLSSNVSGLAGLTSISATGTTAANTLTLGTAQGYTGGAGVSTISIAANATKAITGGAGTADEIRLTGASAGYTKAITGANVTGFEKFAVNNTNLTTSFDMTDFATGNAFSTIAVMGGGTSNTTFTKVVAGTALELRGASTAVVFQTASTSGATDSVSVNLKGTTVTAANGGGTAGYTTTALTLQDANAVGLGNVTINSDASVFQGLHTITTLTDSALTNLNITGTGSLSITAAATAATSLTIADNGTGTSATADGIVTLTASAHTLGNLSYSGTHAFTIGTLANNVANMTITNANTGTTGVLTIGAHTDASLASLTLNGSIAHTGVYALNGAATFSGSSDNAAVSITANGGGVKTITLGNGNDTVITGAAADVITLGNGTNSITAGAGADKVTVGTGVNTLFVVSTTAVTVDAGNDSGTFAAPGTNTISTTGFDVLTGFGLGDKIDFETGYNGAAGAARGLIANGVAANTLVGLGAVDNTVYLVRGTYDVTGKTFVGSATGVDSLFVYDADADVGDVAQEAIVLVGYVATSVAGIGGAAGLVTLG